MPHAKSRWRNAPLAAATLFSLVLLLCACAKEDPDATPLRLGYSPSDHVLADRYEAYKALRNYLARETGREVVLVKTKLYQPAIEAMKEGRIDVMNLGSQAYLIAEEQSAAEAFALRAEPDGSPLDYHSVIVAPSDSPYRTLEQALQDAGQLRMLYTHRASTSGFLVAESHLRRRGIDAIDGFAQANFSNSHSLSLLKACNGQTDLANLSSRALAHLVKQSKVDPAAFRELWRSAPIPRGPVAYRPDLAPELKAKIREAYFDLPRKDPATWALIAKLYPDQPFVYTPYVPSAYDVLR